MDSGSISLVSHKIKSPKELAAIIGSRPRQKKVVMCHGTFDIVHPGHIRHLLYAKSKGNLLIASLTCDAHITKGNLRPHVPEDLRALNLAALEVVDYVVVDREPNPLANISLLQPDCFAKGYEYVDNGLHPKTAEEKAEVERYGGEMIFTPGDIVYSSSSLIESAPPNLRVEKLMLLMQSEDVTFKDLQRTLDLFAELTVHVVGDTIVDTYTHCSMIGGITKTPTISVRFEEERNYVGGAGIVAKHIAAAGAHVTFSTVLGDDRHKQFVLDDLAAAGVHCLPIIDKTRPTTDKNVIIAEGYKLLKIDSLDNRSIPERIVKTLCGQLEKTKADIVVCSDFRHGIFNRHTVPTLIKAIPGNAFRVADSQVASRWGNILEFKDFDLLTPNEREARFALADQDSVVRPLATELFRQAACRTLILKLGDKGILTYRTRTANDPRTVIAVDSFVDTVEDAVGAGDALLAYASLAMVATKGNETIASILGTIAAGVECEHVGNLPVTPDAVRKKLDRIEQLARFS